MAKWQIFGCCVFLTTVTSALVCNIYNPFQQPLSFNRLYNYILDRTIQSLSQLPREYSALYTGLTAGAQKLEPAPSLRLPNAKYPLQLSGVKQ